MSLKGATKDLGKAILNFLKEVWAFIKRKIHDLVVAFKKIVDYFKEPDRLKKLQEDKANLAIAIKENLANGNVNVINCLFNEDKNEVLDYQESQVFEDAQRLDEETAKQFGDKTMIILK